MSGCVRRRNRIGTRFSAVAIMAAPLVAMLSAAPTSADTFEGRINGLRCAEGGHFCPLEDIDAHLSFELEFVLQQRDGEYYFLSNVPRDTKVRYVLKKTKVIGSVIEHYRSITVDALLIEEDDGYREVWSPAAQQRAFEQIYNSGWEQIPTPEKRLGDRR